MKPDINPADAAKELLARRQARDTLSGYMEYVSGHATPRHIQLLCDKLEQCMARKIKRLLVCLPPGHAKSFTVSHHFPAYYLSKFPDHNVIAVTHTESFSETWGRKVRNLMLGDEHRIIFPDAVISEDSRAASRWDLTSGASYFATGVGGAVTGKRGNCVPGNTVVYTTEGPRFIKDIEIGTVSCCVLSYDEKRETPALPTYNRVVAVLKRRANRRARIRTASGRILEATGEHLVYCQRGFIPAETLREGDILLCAVPHIKTRDNGGSREEGASREDAIGGAFDTEGDIVSVVEWIYEDCDVFDIEVEDTHTFFANGILIHNCVIMDDVIRGIEDANSSLVRDNMWNWWGSDLLTRMKPGAIMVFVTTRWHLDDLAGRLIAAEQQGGDKWEKLILPAIALEKDPLGRKPGEALWPEQYDLKLLENVRSQPAMTTRQWESLYQQSPIGEDGGIVKRSWFKPWRQSEPPKCTYTLQSWDTAVSNSDTSAYSACTTWGVFEEPETKLPAMILLSAMRGRLLYPDLRKLAQRVAFNFRDDDVKTPKIKPVKMMPDQILVEDRSSGSSLIADLMRAGISVIKVNPNRSGSKDARLMMATDILENGRVYIPYAAPNFTMPYRWADEFCTELCSFPAAASRDYADSFSQAVDRVKKFGAVRNTEDPFDDQPPREATPRPAYY